MKARSRIKIVHENTNDCFRGRYLGCEIQIDREPDDYFYIQVTAASGCYLYDGWYRGSYEIDDAIEDALVGSTLIKRTSALGQVI